MSTLSPLSVNSASGRSPLWFMFMSLRLVSVALWGGSTSRRREADSEREGWE